jgi:hypothetical protein
MHLHLFVTWPGPIVEGSTTGPGGRHQDPITIRIAAPSGQQRLLRCKTGPYSQVLTKAFQEVNPLIEPSGQTSCRLDAET